jgi:predicted RNA binding protein YcfA (HicA-like mRNA interferase family)
MPYLPFATICSIIFSMTQWEKLRRRIEQNPKAVRFEDLDRLLRAYGFSQRPGKGSHHFYWRGEYRLVIPYRRPHVLPFYVKLALEVIDRAEQEHDHD